jgi:hypothetical protein
MSDNVFQQPTVPTQTKTDEIPVESVTLPSQGLIYPLGHPLNNEKQVEIKCMTAKEEDLLTSRALIKNGTVMSQLLRACILNKAIDPEDMLVGDRNAILIAIRITGYGADYKAKIKCPECDEEFENDFTLNGLKVKPLTVKPAAEHQNIFDFVLPLAGHKVQVRLLTAKDETEISKISEARKKLKSPIDNNITNRLFSSIISINGETDRSKIAQMVNNMRASDSRALRKFLDEVEPGIDMKQEVTCPQCSVPSEVSVPLGMNFFWPDFGD